MSREIDHTVSRVRREFMEMPGLCLTAMQAQRLWSLDAEACAATLAVLIGAGFLRQTGNGLFVRGDQPLPAGRTGGDSAFTQVPATLAGRVVAWNGR